WHPSAEATRLGALAVEIERMMHRDARTLDDAFETLRARDRTLTRGSVELLAAKLPPRTPRRKDVSIAEAESVEAETRDDRAPDHDSASEKISNIVTRYIDGLPRDDRLILQLRFDAGMSVSDVSRALHLDQKPLYRRIERHPRA